MIIFSWILPVILFIPYLIDKELGWTVNHLSFSITVITIITLPLLYFLILFAFKKSRRRIRGMTTSATQRETNNQITQHISKKLVHRSLWLISVYLTCTGLTILGYFIHPLSFVTQAYIFQVINVVFLGNSCANPCIYMYKDKKIRKIAMNLSSSSKSIGARVDIHRKQFQRMQNQSCTIEFKGTSNV